MYLYQIITHHPPHGKKTTGRVYFLTQNGLFCNNKRCLKATVVDTSININSEIIFLGTDIKNILLRVIYIFLQEIELCELTIVPTVYRVYKEL